MNVTDEMVRRFINDRRMELRATRKSAESSYQRGGRDWTDEEIEFVATRAALKALASAPAQGVADGFMVVPIEPTAAMVARAVEHLRTIRSEFDDLDHLSDETIVCVAFDGMKAAAPLPPPPTTMDTERYDDAKYVPAITTDGTAPPTTTTQGER